jgi:DNA-binding transcriptional ArsR family regulator
MPALSRADLLLHPIRLRIVAEISGQRATARHLREALPDLPQTTLYRHLNALTEGGILEVVQEKQIRGTVERTYALSAPPSLTAEDLRGMTKEQYQEMFAGFLGTFMADARRYLASRPEGKPVNPVADGVVISKCQVFLTDAESASMNRKLTEMVLAATRKKPGPGRKRCMVAYLLIPLER